MYIRIDSLKDEILVDVRTNEEFNESTICEYNIPAINKEQRKTMKKFYPSAFFIIFWGVFINRKNHIREEIINLSKENKKIVFACSRGRLRSPMMYIYSKFFLKIDCKVLFGGVKGNKTNK